MSSIEKVVAGTANTSEKKISSIENKIKGIKKSLNLAGLYIVTKKISNVVSDTFKEYTGMIETSNLFQVSLGKIEDGYESLTGVSTSYYEKALDFQDKMATKLYTNKAELEEYQAMYYNMLSSQGIEQQTAYKMSQELTEAGYDIASLFNLEIDNAMDKLEQGLAGQVKGLRQIGIDVSENSLQGILSDLGIDESVSQLSYADKELLRYIAILQQAGKAQGDFAKTMDSPANQIKIFTNQIDVLKQRIGALLSGVFGQILTVANGVIAAINEILGYFAGLFGIELESTSQIGSVAGDVENLTSGLGEATGAAKQLKSQLMGFDEINNITPNTSSGSSGGAGTSGITDSILGALKDLEWDNMIEKASSSIDRIKEQILDFLGFVNGELKDGYTNFEFILDIAKEIGIAILSWKVTSALSGVLKALGIFGTGVEAGNRAISFAASLTFAITSIALLWNGTEHLIDDGLDWKSFSQILAGGAAGGASVFAMLAGVGGMKKLEAAKIAIPIAIAITGLSLTYGSFKRMLNGDIGLDEVLMNVGGTVASAVSIGMLLSKTAKINIKKTIAFTIGIIVAVEGLEALYDIGQRLSNDIAVPTKEVAASFGALMGSGALIGSTFGPVGAAIGTVTGALAGLVAVISGNSSDGGNSKSLVKHFEELYNISPKLTEEWLKTSESVEKMRDSWQKLRAETTKTSQQIVDEQGIYSNLVKELENITDANGKVKKGYEARANFIINELNDAYDLELELIDEEIRKNGEAIGSMQKLTDEINKVINAKKLEMLIEANKEAYVKAIQDQTTAYANLAKQEEMVKAAEEELRKWKESQLYVDELEYKIRISQLGELKKKRDEAKEQVVANARVITATEKAMAASVSEDYEDIQDAIDVFTNTVTEDGKVIELSLSEQVNIIKNNLELIKNNYTDAEGYITDTNNSIYKDTIESLKKISQEVESLTPENIAAWKKLASLSEEEYSKALSELPEDVRKEIEKATGIISTSGNEIVTETTRIAAKIENALSSNTDSRSVGWNLIEGLKKGMIGASQNSGLFSSIQSIGTSILNKFKNVFGIHSPSKETKQFGIYLIEGLGIGIESEENSILSTVGDFSKDLLSEMNNTLNGFEGANVDVKDRSINATSYVDYGAISGNILANGNISVSNNIVEGIATAVAGAMQNIDVNIEARTDEGVIVKKVSQGFREYVTQTGELPFPVPV